MFEKQMLYIVEKEGLLAEANDEFLRFCGYPKDELLNKPFSIVWSDVLRITANLNSTLSETEAFIFTKSFECREVCIQIISKNNLGQTKYFITEISNSRFEDKNQFVARMILDNKTGIGVYTVPDFKLIKANQVYLNCLPRQYHSKELAYGRCISAFFDYFTGSTTEKMLKDLVKNNKSQYISEMQGLMSGNESRYFDASAIPISENDRVKYMVLMFDDVSDRVLNGRHLQRQSEVSNDKVNQILNSIQDEFYALDYDWNFIYANMRLTSKIGKEPKDFIGKNIWDIFPKQLGTAFENDCFCCEKISESYRSCQSMN